ncbi:unnamed protein product [Candida verbasci]|uniref:Peroxisomal ATPase PEX6 n=1 Tax=Candida verbasci TaxID=1227364 RepID=A0A9W4TVU7_9ASCO|nr:unnamed protein product [Candida verbasci]
MPSIVNNDMDDTIREVVNDSEQIDSVSTVTNLQIINDSSINQTDILDISIDVFKRLYPSETDEQFAFPIHELANRYLLVKFLGAPDYFNKYNILKLNRINYKLALNSISFINNTNLISNFDIDSLTLNKSIVKTINYDSIPLLSQIFVSVPSEIYKILNSKTQESIKQQFLTQFTINNDNIINEGDSLKLLNGKIDLCEPLTQGKINESTNIVLINQNEEEIDDVLNDDDDDLDEDLNLSSYLSSSLQFDKQALPIESKKFKVGPLPEKLNIDDLPKNWSKDDNDLFIFINNQDFINLNFPVFNGDLIKLKTEDNQTTIVKIFTFIEPQFNFKKNTVYLSPILLINLNINEKSRVEFEPINEQEESISKLIPIAESVTITRVSSQITMDKTYQKNIFSSLKSILTTQLKCVKQGDLIPVTIDSILAKTMFDNSEEDANVATDEVPNDDVDVIPIGNPDVVAWFKITEVKGDDKLGTSQFLIDPTKTLLVSSGVESIRLPMNEFTNWYRYLNLPQIFNYSNSSLFKYAQDFKKTLKTCITSKINLKTSILLTSMSRGIGKTTLVKNVCNEMGLNLIELDCFDLLNPGQELKTIGILSGKIDKLIANVPTKSSLHVIYLKHIENLCPKIDENDQNSNIFTSLSLKIIQTLNDYLNNYSNLVVVLSCNDYDKLNDNLKSLIKFTFEFTVPSENERLEIFKFLTENEKDKIPSNDINSYPFIIRKDINYKNLALQSAGLTPRDLISIIKKSKKLAIKRLKTLSKQSNIKIQDLIDIGNGGIITWIPEDFNSAINEARNQFSDSIGAPRIPNVNWEDVGGLDLIKDEILDTIDMPLKHPELFNNGLKKRSGILFYGPPGTGKTLLAKAIATNFSLNFFSVKGPELLNMYIGESEANVRRVFQRARDAKPCVIFFDELDSVAPKRGNQGDSGGVMDRIVSQLLAELDGMSSEGGDGVFVVGATNRPDLLDEALLRPGRFDRMLYLGISDTNEKQTKILEALTRKFKLDDQVNLEVIAEKCSFTYTGADFYALCSDSMLNAMTRIANEIDDKIKNYNFEMKRQGKDEVNTRWWFDNIATEQDTTVVVKMEDFVKAQIDLIPSVSAEELQHYLRVRENFEGGKEKAQQQFNEENEQQQIQPQQHFQVIEEEDPYGDDMMDGHVEMNGNGH